MDFGISNSSGLRGCRFDEPTKEDRRVAKDSQKKTVTQDASRRMGMAKEMRRRKRLVLRALDESAFCFHSI